MISLQYCDSILLDYKTKYVKEILIKLCIYIAYIFVHLSVSFITQNRDHILDILS